MSGSDLEWIAHKIRRSWKMKSTWTTIAHNGWEWEQRSFKPWPVARPGIDVHRRHHYPQSKHFNLPPSATCPSPGTKRRRDAITLVKAQTDCRPYVANNRKPIKQGRLWRRRMTILAAVLPPAAFSQITRLTSTPPVSLSPVSQTK